MTQKLYSDRITVKTTSFFLERTFFMYTTLLFDADNTLLDFDKDEKQALTGVMNEYGVPVSEENIRTYSEINQGLWKKFEKGEITKPELKRIRFGLFFDAIGFKTDADVFEVNERYLSFLSGGGNLLEGAKEICQKLSHKGYELYIVTNGVASTQAQRLSRSGILPLFRDVFVSETVGYQKPRKEFFDYVLQNIKEKDKSRILVIGDSLSSDIKGAINSSLKCVWLNRDSAPVPGNMKIDYVIENISQLGDIL